MTTNSFFDQALAPTHSHTTTPRVLRQVEGEWNGFTLLTIAGVGCEHRLIVFEGSTLRVVYAVFPMGGPANAIREWFKTEHDFPAWEVASWNDFTPDFQHRVMLHVMEMAHAELVAEQS